MNLVPIWEKAFNNAITINRDMLMVLLIAGIFIGDLF
jgi:hypothetical protein